VSHPEWPPVAEHPHVREAARSAARGVLMQVAVWGLILFSVACIGKMQGQLADQSKGLSEQAKTLATLTEMKRTELANLAEIAESNQRAMRKLEKNHAENQATLRAVASKVGAVAGERQEQ
jgi:uncharacterized protein HemX